MVDGLQFTNEFGFASSLKTMQGLWQIGFRKIFAY